jgi:hypothetical protein
MASSPTSSIISTSPTTCRTPSQFIFHHLPDASGIFRLQLSEKKDFLKK